MPLRRIYRHIYRHNLPLEGDGWQLIPMGHDWKTRI
jgi:hypothetical protein